MVFSRSLDQNVMRAKPITYNDRKSDAQIKQRVRMKACHGLSKADSKKALDAAFPTRPTKQTKFSAFVQAVIKVIIGALTNVTYDWSKLPSFGNGTLRNLFFDTNLTANSNNLHFEWDVLADITQAESAFSVYVFLFNTSKGQGWSSASIAEVSDGSVDLAYPNGWTQADSIRAFIGTTSPALYNSSPAVQII